MPTTKKKTTTPTPSVLRHLLSELDTDAQSIQYLASELQYSIPKRPRTKDADVQSGYNDAMQDAKEYLLKASRLVSDAQAELEMAEDAVNLAGEQG